MFADIVGYTAAMARSEHAGLALRRRHRKLVKPLVEAYGGHWIEEIGDESLTSFESAVAAANCALAIQAALRGDSDLQLRIGIHVGDVIFECGRVFGDGVNVAARVRPHADPGGVCVTSDA
jgi:class 3 adenylate cyclase